MEHHEDLHLIVVSPESTLFDGKVEIVTLPGELGSFSVLYDHAPLISSLIKRRDKIHGGRIGEINWNIEWVR